MGDRPVALGGILARHPAVACAAVAAAVSLILWLFGMGREPPRAAQAQDAAAQEAAGPAATPPADAETAALVQRLWYAVIDLRNKCAVEGARGWDSFLTPEARKQLDTISWQVWQGEADLGWSYFFGRSLFEIARPSSLDPLVGFYHPWSDVWLLVQWRTQPEAKVTGIELVCGEWLRRRGEPPLDLQADWLRREGFRVEQLARAAIDNLDEFNRLAYGRPAWREALRLEEHKQPIEEVIVPAASVRLLGACLRADELALGADAFEEGHSPPPVLMRLIESCKRFLAAGREGRAAFFVDLAAGTSPATAKLLHEMPVDAYAQLVPVFWLADDQWAQAYLVPDHNPDFCLALTYKQADGRLRLTRLDMVHFPTVAAVMAKEAKK